MGFSTWRVRTQHGRASVVHPPRPGCRHLAVGVAATSLGAESGVATIPANHDLSVGEILDEVRHLRPVGNDDVMRSAAVSTVATFVGHLIPLFPFLTLSRHAALVFAVVLSALVLFGVGTYSALTRIWVWWRSGIKMIANRFRSSSGRIRHRPAVQRWRG
jgi:hypothetical protein